MLAIHAGIAIAIAIYVALYAQMIGVRKMIKVVLTSLHHVIVVVTTTKHPASQRNGSI